MRKVLALAVVAVFCSIFALANEPGEKHEHGKAAEGTISKVDMAGKSMVVKFNDGTEKTIYWNDSTKVMGTPKEGETVHVRTSEKDGKTWATWVHVGKMEGKGEHKAEPKTEPNSEKK